MNAAYSTGSLQALAAFGMDKTSGRLSKGLGAYLIGAQLLGGAVGASNPADITGIQRFEGGLAGGLGAGMGAVATPVADSIAGYQKGGVPEALRGAVSGAISGPRRGYDEAQRIRMDRPWMKYTPDKVLFKR